MTTRNSLIILLATLLAIPAPAQESETYLNENKATEIKQYRHNLEVWLGGPTEGLYIFNEGEYVDFSQQYTLKKLYENQISVSGDIIIGANYGYYLKDWLSVGAEASWGLLSAQISPGFAYEQDEKDEDAQLNQHLIMLMPAVKAEWLKGKYLTLYSRLSAGAYLSVGKYQKTHVMPSWEFVFFGASLGVKNFYFFEDVGVGTCYIVRYGLGFKF